MGAVESEPSIDAGIGVPVADLPILRGLELDAGTGAHESALGDVDLPRGPGTGEHDFPGRLHVRVYGDRSGAYIRWGQLDSEARVSRAAAARLLRAVRAAFRNLATN